MRPRDSVLIYRETQSSDASTKTIDMDLVDPVTALYIELEATNGATSNKGNFLSDCVTKLEIVDGSEVLYSVNAIEAQALHFYKQGKTPTLFPSEFADGTQREGFFILFGRKLYDLAYAIDFSKFKNPQLKITWNMAAIRAVGATGYLTGTLKLTVVAKVLEGMAAPGRYLMAKELMSFTSSATSGAEERKELPTDLPYRMLMTRHWVQLSDIDEVTSDLKLTADADKYIAFNRKVRQLDAEAFALFGAGRVKHDIFTQHQAAFRLLFNKEPSLLAFAWEDATPEIVGVRYTWSSEGKLDLNDNAGATISTDMKMTTVEEGHALHATLALPFGDLWLPETWFDPTSYKKLELVFTSGGTAGTCAVVAEQVRPN